MLRHSIGIHKTCYRGDAFIFLQLTWLAALWIVSQSLIGKELLLPGTENELLATIYAPQDLVVVLVHLGPSYTGLDRCRRLRSNCSYSCNVYRAVSL